MDGVDLVAGTTLRVQGLCGGGAAGVGEQDWKRSREWGPVAALPRDKKLPCTDVPRKWSLEMESTPQGALDTAEWPQRLWSIT